MIEVLVKLGVRGSIGFLLGIIAIWWLEPNTTGGAFLVVAVFIAISIVVGALFSKSKPK